MSRQRKPSAYTQRCSLDDSWLSDAQRRVVDEVLAGVSYCVVAPAPATPSGQRKRPRSRGGALGNVQATGHMQDKA